MLTPSLDGLSRIKIDYKQIELLRRAALAKNVKVTPEHFKQLDECGSVDEVIPLPSTSAIAFDEFDRKTNKRKIEEEKNLLSGESCPRCNCRMLRSVDPGRTDGRLVLECMRSNCLASIKFTTLPVGTVIGHEKEPRPRNAYNSMSRYYPKGRYTPTPSDGEEDSTPGPSKRKPRGGAHKKDEIFEVKNGRDLYVRVSGQDVSARIW
ncbi:unnamed protein product [Caenorhabditis sp. 36 PRJEB53466]|nr:unnamed protein product [Caenorhabditis sp. 36 PRJEB53466]